MTGRMIVRELLTVMGAVALSVAGFYFGTAGQTNRLLMTCILLVIFLFAVAGSWYNKKKAGAQSTNQHLLPAFLFGLFAVAYLAQAVMDPFNGWKSARMWLFGLSWLLLAIRELVFFRKTDMRESR